MAFLITKDLISIENFNSLSFSSDIFKVYLTPFCKHFSYACVVEKKTLFKH